MTEQRKLAAVMFTDITGYTALMSKDEQKALTLLQMNRELQKLLADPFLREGVSRHTIESLNNPLFLKTHKQRTVAWVRPRMKNIIIGIGEAHRSGVKIALGTDAGFLFNFPGYSSHLEMELLAKAGLSPMEILVAATRRGAEMPGAENLFGTIEVGKRADLIILNANPLDDIRNTRTIDAVFKDGKLLDRDTLIKNQ